jgi:GTP-binding protein
VNRPDAPSPRGLLVSEFVTSLASWNGAIPGPALPEIAFAGRSNVGKSSLINLLMGRRDLARASRIPGKTRFLNVYRWGPGCYLVDLPGYGWARAAELERAAWQRLVNAYLARRETLAGVVWLLDIRRAPSPDDRAVGARLRQRAVPTLVVLTKADQVPRREREARAAAIALGLELDAAEFVLTSSKTREGAEDLRDSVLAHVG